MFPNGIRFIFTTSFCEYLLLNKNFQSLSDVNLSEQQLESMKKQGFDYRESVRNAAKGEAKIAVRPTLMSKAYPKISK